MTNSTLKDRTGLVYGRLTVIERAKGRERKGKSPRVVWLCVCSCGNLVTVLSEHLQSGNTKSCGCLKKETSSLNVANAHASVLTHGMSYSKTYRIWEAMKSRCNNEANESYHNYGERGISYDPSWELFSNFYSDMGDQPEGLQLERLNNELGYSKANCAWVTSKKQNRNKRTNIRVEYQGEIHSIAEWCDKLGLPYDRIYRRIRKLNWPVPKAFEKE